MTGFGPFPGIANNPSGALVETLQSSNAGFYRTAALLLPTSYQRAFEELVATDLEVTAIVIVGYAAGTTGMRLEQVAFNEAAAPIPDIDGHSVVGALDEAGPFSLRTSADVVQLAAAAESVGCPAVLSTDPGRYVCNATYYKALRRYQELGVPVVMAHIGDWTPHVFHGDLVAAGLEAVVTSVAGSIASAT